MTYIPKEDTHEEMVNCWIYRFVSDFNSCTCGGGKDDSAKGGENKDTITVKHAMGTEERVPADPKRVVVLTNEGTEALLELGIKPVGAVKSWTGDPWYKHIQADMKGVKQVGLEGEPNIEAIAELKPDLIIGNKMRHEKIYDKLEKNCSDCLL